MLQRAPLGCGLLLLSGIVGLATIGGFIFLIMTQLQGLGANSQRFAGPGSHTFTVPEAGLYTLFHETQSVIDGTVYTSPGAPATLSVRLTDAQGAEIPLKPTSGGTYTVGPYAGNALFDVDLPAPGVYTATVSLAPGQSGPVVIALGEGIGPSLLATVFGSVSLMFVGLSVSSIAFVAGLILLLIGMRKARGD